MGSNFRQSSRLACRFGSAGVDARMVVPAALFINSSALLCISPPRLAPAANPAGTHVAVEVTNNAAVGGRSAASSTFSRSGVFFRYEDVPRFDGVVPRFGPVSGNFSVRITGGPFPETHELRCETGEQAAHSIQL